MNMTVERCQAQQELSDLALMEQASTGNQEAFEQIVHRYHYVLSRYVWARLGNETASDVVQFVWLQLYLTLPRLIRNQRSGRQEASIKPWLFRIASNRCIDEHRKDMRHPRILFSELEQGDEDENASVLDSLLDTMPLPEDIAEHQENDEHLRIAIRSLPSDFRHVVELRYKQELTFREIGRLLSMPQATVKTYYYRACKQLRHTLASEMQEALA